MPAATEASIPTITKPLTSEAQQKLPALIPRKRRSPPQNPQPVPETPQLPEAPGLSAIKPEKPNRRILSVRDHEIFLNSETYKLILSFIFSLSESCIDRKISSAPPADQFDIVKNIHSILDSVSELVDAHPPADQGASRFGNPAFRDFIDDLSANLPSYHERLNLPSAEWVAEVSTYLEHSFGSRARIDYGSGHELNFAIWLLCLNRLSLLPSSAFAAVILNLFPRYIKLLRKIQSTYYLEPAGSHGVWGLDDYHFLPFMFGASQLLHHPYIRPLAIHNDLMLEEEGDEFMYLDMVRWTMETKTVKGLKWTQPMLDDISGAKDWIKVEQGMRRMFVKEVLGKLPIMQHFMFGSLVPAAEGMSLEDDHEPVHDHDHVHEHPGHVHRDDVWGDCCGIKIPSTVAASEDARKRGLKEGLRRVPFD
ncbi:MAG: Serine/threonine-protein phosphatase 2A activator 2 [Stictis urceolatum]|nr:Serine/threonine-protein phosphatase 2A activator 2 [Stictis urceolata]